MIISKLEIKNFRSIEHITIEPKGLCVLVGPNSVGKTNILKALDILLGETYPTERAFKKEDFLDEDTNKTISIQVNFAEPLGEFKLTNKDSRQKELCNPISLRLTYTNNPQEYFRTQFTAITENGVEYWGNGDVRDSVSFLYIPSERNLERQMTTSQWTLLGKILYKINENFSLRAEGEELNEQERSFREAMEKPRSILESEFDPSEITYAKFKKKFIITCSEMASGLADSFELDLEIYDPLFYYKTVQIIGNENEGRFNIQELGSGVQNLVLLALIRTYASLFKGRVILAIEEPEIFLYPQAQRYLYEHFRSLAYPDEGRNTQIFYTTHNPNFVDAHHAYEIEILRKPINSGTINLQKDQEYLTEETAERERFRIYTHFNAERNELFFAQKILLVEGESDKILWTALCEKRWDVGLNKNGISIIECGGKGGVNYFVGICNLMGLQNYFAVWDQDDEEDYNPEKDWLSELTEDNGLQIPVNLEKFLGLPEGNGAKKVKNAYEWAMSNENQTPAEFERIKNFLISDLEQDNQVTSVDEQLEKDISADEIPL